jgi:hypothetical protein
MQGCKDNAHAGGVQKSGWTCTGGISAMHGPPLALKGSVIFLIINSALFRGGFRYQLLLHDDI